MMEGEIENLDFRMNDFYCELISIRGSDNRLLTVTTLVFR